MNLVNLLKKVSSTIQEARDENVEDFIQSHIELEQELFRCMKHLSSTIEATQKLASMKMNIIGTNLLTLIFSVLMFGGLYYGISFIQHDTANYVSMTLVSAFLGWYIWERIKHSSPVFWYLREINKHEKNLVKNINGYLLAGEVLKNYHAVGTSYVQKFIEEGKYNIDDDDDDDDDDDNGPLLPVEESN